MDEIKNSRKNCQNFLPKYLGNICQKIFCKKSCKNIWWFRKNVVHLHREYKHG